MASGVEFPPEARARFLAALALTGKISGDGGAAEHAQIAVPTLYAWRNRDQEFAQAWDEAKAMRGEIIAEKGWNVVEEILDDKGHKDRLAAAKVAIESAPIAQSRGGADADGIAEAIDRFTHLVGTLAARAAQDPERDRAGVRALDAD